MLIDLSVLLNEDTPVYPGDPKTKIEPRGVLSKDGYTDHYVCAGTHVGTHIDAPSHMVEGGVNIDQLPLEQFSGKGVYIDATRGFDLEAVKRLGVGEGDIVLFHTGKSEVYHKPEYYEQYPAIPEPVANYLVERKVKVVGVDMCSPDHPPFPIHKILLGNGVLIIENLTNLAALKGKDFRIHAFPLKVQLDGSPVRVVAEI